MQCRICLIFLVRTLTLYVVLWISRSFDVQINARRIKFVKDRHKWNNYHAILHKLYTWFGKNELRLHVNEAKISAIGGPRPPFPTTIAASDWWRRPGMFEHRRFCSNGIPLRCNNLILCDNLYFFYVLFLHRGFPLVYKRINIILVTWSQWLRPLRFGRHTLCKTRSAMIELFRLLGRRLRSPPTTVSIGLRPENAVIGNYRFPPLDVAAAWQVLVVLQGGAWKNLRS